MAYYRIEPFGPVRGDFQAGVVAAAVFNSRRTKKSDEILQAGDFLLKFVEGDGKVEEKTPEELLEAFRAIAAQQAASKTGGSS